MNLVGPGPIAPHFLDTKLAFAAMPPVGCWVDLGSGAGFPGLVLAAEYPALSIDLVDSRQKRATFLEAVVAEAREGDRVRVRNVRAEDLPLAAWDGATSRAFAPPIDALAACAARVRPGGRVVLFLNADDPLPEAPVCAVFHVEHYWVEGKPRRAVGWVVNG